MAAPSAILGILFKADTGAATAAIAKTDAQLASTAATAGKATTATSKSGAAMRKLGTAAKWGGAAIAVGFVYEAKKAVDTTQELTKSTLTLQKNLGLSAKKASEWGAVARARGVDSNKLGMAFKTLSGQVEAARKGSESSVAIFKELGVSQKDLIKGSTDLNSLLFKVADGMEAMGEGTERTAITSKLFGRGWSTLGPLIRDGSGALRENLALTEKYGATLSGQTLKAQEELLANTRETQIAWMGMQVSLARIVTPAFNDLHDQIQRVAAIMASDRLTNDEKLKKVAKIVQQDFQKALDVVLKMIPEFASQMGQAAVKVAAAFVQGFMDADVWGKLFLGGWLLKKLISGAMLGKAATAGAAFAAAWVKKAALVMAIGLSRAGGIGAVLTAAGPWGALGLAAAAAFYAGWKSGLGDKVADVQKTEGTFREFLSGLKEQFGNVAKASQFMSQDVRKSWYEQARAAKNSGEISQKQYLDIIDKLNKGRAAYHDTADAAEKMSQRVAAAFQDQQQKVSHAVNQMVDAVLGGINHMTKQTNKALHSLGAREVDFQIQKNKGNVQHGAAGLKTGGLAGMVPGSGGGDQHTLSINGVPIARVQSGEGIFVGKRGLMGTLQQANAAAPNVPHMARGGVVSGDVQGLVPAFMSALTKMAGSAHQAIFVNSGFRTRAEQAALYARYGPGRAAPPGSSHHELGIAADINPGQGTFGGIAGRYGLGFTVPGEPWHIELLNAAAAGKFGAPAQRIARVLLKGPAGTLRSAGQGALDKVHGAANAYLAKQVPKLDSPLPSATGTGAYSKAQLAALWQRANDGLGDPTLMARIALAESGGNPRAVGPSTQYGQAKGLWQILGLPFPGNPFNPITNARMAGAKLRSQGLSAWEAYTNGSYLRYGTGGKVGGPLGRAQAAIVHGGETIMPGNRPVRIHFTFEKGMEWLAEFINTEIDSSIPDMVDITMREAGKNRSRARTLQGRA